MPANLSSTSKIIDTILVLDFGSQYTQLIARRVRELGVYSEIFPWDSSPEIIKANNPKGIILSGGPESVTESNTPRIPEHIFKLNVPILGICYGMQTLAEQFGGQFSRSKAKEFGLRVNAGHDLNLENLPGLRKLDLIDEVSIGHAIITQSLIDGFNNTIKKYLEVING